MTTPTGISARLMTAEQATYATGAVVDRGVEFRQESLKLEIARIASTALRGGTLIQRSDRWKAGRRAVTGDITMEVADRGFGRWFKHMLGGASTGQPDAVNSPTVYRHVFTPGTLPPGLTVQVGRPDAAGVVRPFTYTGCRVRQWTLEATVNELLTLTVALIGRDATTETPLAELTYPAGAELFSFIQGSLTVDSSAMPVRRFQMQGGNTLGDERYFLGSALRDRPEEIGLREITGTVEPEFTSLDVYHAFVAGSEAEMVLRFQGDVIEDALPYALEVTANVRYDGAEPNVDGPQQLLNPWPFAVVDNGTLSLEIAYQTTDTTP
ncbi:phage tail tube protein [Saccharothrix australiensis]|uniref:Tail protein n=1 Tax=Saccharothrix australiensis TaxID=2072 RepID=A0A495VKD6_9PSEU|nr:phage tail tube protein [Saccharothrix australiensis]RKT49360.1 hypothetical protein C8E97_6739 [Saccharothrix australiensis]